MNANGLISLITGLIVVASLVAIFGYKKIWASLALFGFMWVVMAVRDMALHADTFDLAVHIAAAVAFFYYASVQYRK